MNETDNYLEDDLRYMRLTKFLLQLCGQWPYTSRLKKIIGRIAIIMTLANGIPFLVMNYEGVFQSLDNKQAYVSTLLPTPPDNVYMFHKICEPHNPGDEGRTRFYLLFCSLSTMLFASVTARYYLLIQIKLLLVKLQNSWRFTYETTERKILTTYSNLAKSTMYTYAGSLYIAMVFFLLTPLTPAMVDMILPLNESRPKHLVYPVDYGVPIEDHYALFMAHNYACTFAAITILVASDLFFVSVVYHACSLFAVARHRIEHVADNITSYTTNGMRTIKLEEIYGQTTFDTIFMQRVAYSVIYHKRAIEYADLVENTYSWCLFLAVGFNMFIISLTGFQVLTQKDRWDDVLLCLVYIFGQLCHLYLLSLPGQLLKNESGNIINAIYDSYNFEVPIKAQKMLLPMMVRGSKSNEITAGSLFVMDMESFMSILQSSASYFTLLANFA